MAISHTPQDVNTVQDTNAAQGTNAAQDMDTATQGTAKTSYSKEADVRFLLRPEPTNGKKTGDWKIDLKFYLHDLQQTMEEGLFWTTSNVVTRRSWIAPSRASDIVSHKKYAWQRHWELSEFPGRPRSECRWYAILDLRGHSEAAVADLRLDTLTRRNIFTAIAVYTERPQQVVFRYDAPDVLYGCNYNVLLDDLQPKHESWEAPWWCWPMDTVRDTKADEARKGQAASSSRSDPENPPPYEASPPQA